MPLSGCAFMTFLAPGNSFSGNPAFTAPLSLAVAVPIELRLRVGHVIMPTCAGDAIAMQDSLLAAFAQLRIALNT